MYGFLIWCEWPSIQSGTHKRDQVPIKETGAPSWSVRKWIDLKIWHQDSSPHNCHQSNMTYWWSSGTWAKVINLTQTFLSAVTPIKYVHGYGVLCLVVITPVLCWFFWSAISRVVMIRIYWHQRYRRFTLWASSAVAIDDLVFMITTPWWLDNTKIKRHMRHGVSNHWQLDRSSSWLYSLATRKIIKAPLFWLFVRETTVDQWVSLTKGH